MNLAEKLAQGLKQAETDPEYWCDIAITDFTRDLHRLMRDHQVSQGELARRMGTSRPYVTKLLNGSNFTLQTMVKLAMALHAVVRVRLESMDERERARLSASAASENLGVVVNFSTHQKAAIQTTTESKTIATTASQWLKWG